MTQVSPKRGDSEGDSGELWANPPDVRGCIHAKVDSVLGFFSEVLRDTNYVATESQPEHRPKCKIASNEFTKQ